MMKLTYTDDEQIVADAAKMLIKAHLDWSGSDETMPSRDRGCVQGMMFSAYFEAKFTDDEFNAMSDEEKAFESAIIGGLYKEARIAADKKWEAAMTLLDL